MQNFLRINEKDNVAVALKDVFPGECVEAVSVSSLEESESVFPFEESGAESSFEESCQGGILPQASSVKESCQAEMPDFWGKACPPGGVSMASEKNLAEKAAAVSEKISALEKIPMQKKIPAQKKIPVLEKIPAGHKMALCDIPAGCEIVKYGYCIGIAREDIKAGTWVHTHNLKTALGDLLEYSYHPVFQEEGDNSEVPGREFPVEGGESQENNIFQGFVRSDGSVGVRNEIWIIPTVGCVNNVAAAIARQAAPYKRGTVDEVIAFSHPYGCSQMGDDQENTRKILVDLISHPNVGGVLVLGLGCENSNIDVLKPYLGDYDTNRVKFLVAQEWEDEIEEGVKLVRELIEYGASFERQPVSINKLVIGLKCGGSDGFSGITANPLVGRFSDKVIAEGGTTILTEVPEMFGAETILMNRCATQELFQETVALINDFKQYFKSHNQTIYENPSPGNKAGGISTLEDKSLGCTQKSGSAPVKGVLQYGEKVKARGLNLLSAPGNDLVASTALAAAGAQIVLFTTGRGTPFASPVPTVKISSNSGLACRKSNWIDFNAGVLAEEGSWEQEAEKLYRYVLAVASGKKVRCEIAGYHDMAILKGGVTL